MGWKERQSLLYPRITLIVITARRGRETRTRRALGNNSLDWCCMRRVTMVVTVIVVSMMIMVIA